MATQKDLQELIRILTTGRNKVPMMTAMMKIKSLQSAGLRSISDIVNTDVATVKNALSGDEKTAKSLHAACKTSLDPSKKRSASELEGSSLISETKRAKKSAYELDAVPQTPAEFEASLALPAPSRDAEEISRTVLLTNRAPLVLAFAYMILASTRPEQPVSSRLSLAQAVVSANSKSKAVALGLREGEKDGGDGWGTGQPRIKVLGREVAVLKRGGYEWRGEQRAKEDINVEGNQGESPQAGNVDADLVLKPTLTSASISRPNPTPQTPIARWLVSSPTTLKKSTFVGRAIEVTSALDAKRKLSQLLESTPDLASASHNITAFRIQRPGFLAGIVEECNDDGETGGGRHLLRMLQETNIFGVLLVCTRWYGGIMLGPDRWKLMSEVCREALSQRLRVAGTIDVKDGGGEALWGLDLTEEAVKMAGAGQMPVCKPEGARSYILKAFASAESQIEESDDKDSPKKKEKTPKKKTGVALELEKEHNLALLLGALELLFESWKGHISAEELDRRAWGWYVQVRPDVADGVAGWGGKGDVRLRDILGLRRKG